MNQQPPAWGSQPQPTWGAPPPSPPDNTKKTAGIIVAAIVGFLAIGTVLVSALGGSSDDTKPKATATATSSAPDSIAERNKTRKAAGLTLYPTGRARAGYLEALRGIDDWFVDDKGETDAVENGVDQCDAGVDGKRPVWAAQQRFGKDGPGGRKVTAAEAKRINEIVVKYICPDKG